MALAYHDVIWEYIGSENSFLLWHYIRGNVTNFCIIREDTGQLPVLK